MKRVGIAVLVCLSAPAACAGSAATTNAPRFAFRAGEVLTYTVSMTSKGTSFGEKCGVQFEGSAVLEVVSVRPDGTAEIKVTGSGKGEMRLGREAVPLDQGPLQPLVALAKPNGEIAEFRDATGRRTSLFEATENVFNAGEVARQLVLSTYALFGLCLPDKLPAPGGAWEGSHKSENVTSPLDSDNVDIELRPQPVSFTYKGNGKCQDMACLIFEAAFKQGGPGDTGTIPTVFCFDDKEGRLLAMEQHTKSLGAKKWTMDLVVRLVAPPAAAQ